MNDLKNLKVGDKVWTIQDGWTEVKAIVDHANLIETKAGSFYYRNGNNICTDKHPSLFLTNPFEENKGYWAMVSDEPINENNKGEKRFVFLWKNSRFLAWTNADTEEKVNKEIEVNFWKYAVKIEEPKEVELTIEQIAEKFNVDVKLLKIKK